MPHLDVTRAECLLIATGMNEGLKQAQVNMTELLASPSTTLAEINETRDARDLMQTLRDKAIKAIAL